MSTDAASYELGDDVLLAQEFEDQVTGALYNPSAVTLRTRNPLGAIVTQSPVVNASTGKFSFELSVTTAGEWIFEWKSIDVTHGDTVDTGRFYVNVSPIDSPTTGLVARLVQSLMPITWSALRDADYYGDALLAERIKVAKYTILPLAIVDNDEGSFTPLMRDYIATLAAVEIIPAGIEYWMQQKISVSATGTNETTSYTDRQLAFLKSLLPQLLRKIAVLSANPDIIAIATLPGTAPDVTQNDDGILVTSDPYEFLPAFGTATTTSPTTNSGE